MRARRRAHERRGQRHRPHSAHRQRSGALHPLLGEALPLSRDDDADQRRRRRLLHRQPHRHSRPRRAERPRAHSVRSGPGRAPSLLLPRAQPRGRRRHPSLPRRPARRTHRTSAGGRALRARVLLGALRGPRRHPRRGELRSRQGSPRRGRPTRPRRRRSGGSLWQRRCRMTSAARRAHSVETTLNYLAPMAERPAYYLYEPPPGTPWRNTKGDRHQLAIRDARDLAPAPSLDVEGFALVPFTTAVDDFSDAQAVRTRYYREVERLVARVTGAARVVAFDHNLRSATVAGRQADGLQGPVRYAHNDYTERSAPQRVRDLLGADAA